MVSYSSGWLVMEQDDILQHRMASYGTGWLITAQDGQLQHRMVSELGVWDCGADGRTFIAWWLGGHFYRSWLVTQSLAGVFHCLQLAWKAACGGQWVLRMFVKLCDSSGDTRLGDLSTQSDSPVKVKYMESWMSALVMDRSNCWLYSSTSLARIMAFRVHKQVVYENDRLL